MPHEQMLSHETENCIDICMECRRMCIESIQYSLTEGGKLATVPMIGLFEICADVCMVAAKAMLLSSDIHTKTCETCADICEITAGACEAFDDPFMKGCAEIARQCAESCRGMTDQPTPIPTASKKDFTLSH